MKPLFTYINSILIAKNVIYFKKKTYIVFKVCNKRWKLKIVGALNFGICWGCEINDYSQFPSWIFLTLNFTSISYDSSSQGGYSSLM